MVEPVLWATLTIASVSLIFAYIAFRQVMKTSNEVHGFMVRMDRFLTRVEAQAKGIFTPDFMGETISHVVTKGLQNEDGSQVTMPQYINGYVMAYGPTIYHDLKKEIPKYIPLLLNPGAPIPPSPGGPPNKGKQLADARWGSGGLDAAKNFGKAAKKVPMVAKVGEVIETGQALVGLIQPARELIAEVKSIKGAGGNGGQNAGGGGESAPPANWGPPL